MVSTFNTKFFYVNAKYNLAELGHGKQYPGEALDLLVKRFPEKALDCNDLTDDEVLINI